MTSRIGSVNNGLCRREWPGGKQLYVLALVTFALLGIWAAIAFGARLPRTDRAALDARAAPVATILATATQLADHNIESVSRLSVPADPVAQGTTALTGGSSALSGPSVPTYSADLVAGMCEPFLSRSLRSAQALAKLLSPGSRGRGPSSEQLPPIGTPAQQLWVRDQLTLIEEACARGGAVEAVWRLEDVQEVLLAKRNLRVGDPAGPCQLTARLATDCTVAADRLMGRRTVNVEPAPSRLSTAIAPSWSASTIATR